MSPVPSGLRGAQRALQARLLEHLPQRDQLARKPALDAVAGHVVTQVGNQQPGAAGLVSALVAAADTAFYAVARIEADMAHLTVDYNRASTESERHEVLAKALHEHSVDAKELRKSLSALRRWFDLEAMQERMAIQAADQTDQVEVAYCCAASVTATLSLGRELLAAFGGGVVVETAYRHALNAKRDSIRRAALRLLTQMLTRLPAHERIRSLGGPRYVQICEWAKGLGATRWVQVAALDLAVAVAPAQAPALLRSVLQRRERRDGMVGRRNALRLVAEGEVPQAQRLDLVRCAADDPSEHVRQQLAWTLAALTQQEATPMLAAQCQQDSSPRVRGVAARALVTRALATPGALAATEAAVSQMLSQPQTPLDTTVALECVGRLCCGPQPACKKSRFVRELVELSQHPDTSPGASEQAAALLRRLGVEAAPLLWQLAQHFEKVLGELKEGSQRRLQLDDTLRLRDVEYALSTAARDDLTVSLKPLGRGRYLLRRGERRGLRLWRLIHELRTPAPDKRKAFAHSHGRLAGAGSVVPSHLLAEVTATRVPGERRLSPAVGGWAPFLPRIDDLLEAARPFRTPVRIVTSLGVMTVAGPSGLLKRLWTWLRLSLRYAHLDQVRQRALNGQSPEQRQQFTRACEAMGFTLTLGETQGEVGDQRYELSIPRFSQYLSGFALPDLRAHVDGLVQYALSPTGSAPWHLAGLVWLVLSGFLVRAAWVMSRIERARRAIPISVGGWGTRGKSGTERLKAALFHALRYDVVVKTTGCEAMFIHARRDLPAREIFLYRPYDKATIWEQRKVLEFGEQLGAQVFLWECMALNPRFVEVLNRDWMQDPVTTLTNAYPDHEDIMGPSGEDVARVIGLFMPKRGTTYTAEEQMLPILREMARRKRTNLVPISPLEADLLPKDLLERFPYDEHPRNIALVLRLADHYEIDREFALVEIGDRVVPDLGVLKTYPVVGYRGRKLEFSNGMSANERAGFLSNWSRLGFDQMDPDQEPDRFSVAVVNNRADRVPRSRVFANILAADANVNCIVLIGTNLDGMQQFLAESVEANLPELSISDSMDWEAALDVLETWLRRIGMPTQDATLGRQLEAMLGALTDRDTATTLMGDGELQAALESGSDPTEVLQRLLDRREDTDSTLRQDLLTHVRRHFERYSAIAKLRETVRGKVAQGAAAEATQLARDALRTLSMSRVHVLEDAGAKGDQVVHFVTSQIPPGFHARLLGCQNIKGTGLDFVYRWLSVQAITDVLAQLEEDPASRAENLSALTTYSDYGILDCLMALEAVESFLQRSQEAWQQHRPLMESVRDHLKALLQGKTRALSESKKKSALQRFLDNGVEPLIDHWDSTRRTELSQRVMADLFRVRIGQGRAALLMRDLVLRQKGGWLSRELLGLFTRKR